MTWERMTIDELAAFEKAVGSKVVKVNGVWWRETKPFFFRPLNIMEEVQPNGQYPKKSLLGGVQHRVEVGEISNSVLNYFIFDDLNSYSMENFNTKKRWEIRKGINNFLIKPVTDFEEFLNAGHDVYSSFYQRTKYKYRKDRIRKNRFGEWAKDLFNFPKILLLGAYQKEKLAAISISCFINDSIYYTTFFSKTEALALNVSDAMLHYIRGEAKDCENAKYIIWGMATGKENIDRHKLYRGCELVPFPAYFRLNPLIFHCIRLFWKNHYQRLKGKNSNMNTCGKWEPGRVF
jgi:hypothetical protein